MHSSLTMIAMYAARSISNRSPQPAGAPQPASQPCRLRFAASHIPFPACALAVASALLGPLTPAHAAPPPPQPEAASPLSFPAHSWAVDCAVNEIQVIQHPGSYLRYRMHVIDEKGDQVRDQIETPEGSVARLILRDGKALTPDQDSAERDRLNYHLNSPESFARHIKNEQSNKKMGADLLKLMPDAMLWSYTPGQPQLPGQSASQPGSEVPLVVLDFKPNPAWQPPTIPAEALTGLEGRVWIDPQTRRMVRFDGNVFHAVNMGWGMLAHIYPGGTVTMEQTQAAGERWIVEHIVEQVTVRALMVKNVRQRLVFDTSDFQVIPPMTYQQAIKMLLNTPLPTH